jgi:hypothetical protein
MAFKKNHLTIKLTLQAEANHYVINFFGKHKMFKILKSI